MQKSLRRIDKKELCAALVIILIGFLSFWMAMDFSLGTLRRMGPGFVPSTLSIVLMALGAMLLWQAARSSTDVTKSKLDIRLRPALLVLGAMLAWALLVLRIGFVPSTFLLVVLCSAAERGTRPIPTLIWAAAICLFGYVVFIYGLKIPLPVFGGR